MSRALGLFPAVARAGTAPYLPAVLQAHTSSMHSAASARTVSARRLHYLWFCVAMRWDDNLTLEGTDPKMLERAQLQFAMYAVHLSAGHSIHCKAIKAGTISQYILAAATLIQSFTEVDYRKDKEGERSNGRFLTSVMKDIRKYETMADRREPYDHKMHMLARQVAAKFPITSQICALTDGFEQGMCGGFRLTEWAQPSGKTNVARPHSNGRPLPSCQTCAVVPNDYRAVTASGGRVVGLAILSTPCNEVLRIFVKLRTQKNGNNGEERQFERNPTPGGLCFVTSTYRALTRFAQIQLLCPAISAAHTPLAIYWDPRVKRAKLVDAHAIERFMRRLASAVYNLDPVVDADDLALWSSTPFASVLT
ncbi:unknown protein [Seminavis robusta]|uniref:Uncharacterized protein n=1 Tax=Seminavis robusta TaxID=568900 RepID=A0A9N8EVN4_9STRA|nr:unknown protein [Seminavis robusta]|eukprot:Sro1823_g299950.1 n/a (365) ;mRNA; r:17346-18440